MSEVRSTAVVGLGASNAAVVRHLYGTTSLVAIDDRTEPPGFVGLARDCPDVHYQTGPDARVDWNGVERAIVAPGLGPRHPLLDGKPEDVAIDCDIGLFCDAANAPVIGITGTNGKSTVTALVGHLLEAFGLNVGVGGNIGAPALTILDGAREAYVLELSSFQIELAAKLELAAATVLNVSDDHLDRHGDIDSYAAIKRRIFASAEQRIYNAEDARTTPRPAQVQDVAFGDGARWSVNADGWLTFDGAALLPGDQLPLAGQHNANNALAALALCGALEHPRIPEVSAAADKYACALRSFVGLPHRAQRVATIDGVHYVDDSKATNVGASVAALQGMGERVILLLGGQGKGADFAPLAAPAAKHARRVLVYGEDAARIASALQGHASLSRCGGLDDAFAAAVDGAVAGDTVLLAPACASFDEFDNFEARGRHFQDLVNALEGQR
ncbi:MAG: UDP-N-acetylmuramoyl-L-alanine--D-glutamate ligase [Pseudomonadota bacterium]